MYYLIIKRGNKVNYPAKRPKNDVIYWDDSEETYKQLLLYRKIVEVRGNSYQGELVLDDGTVLKIVPNEGCSGCGAGYFYIDELNTCDNIITDVQIEYDTGRYNRNFDSNDECIRIFVLAEDTRIKIIDVSGNEGNGYYGRGFVIYVEKP